MRIFCFSTLPIGVDITGAKLFQMRQDCVQAICKTSMMSILEYVDGFLIKGCSLQCYFIYLLKFRMQCGCICDFCVVLKLFLLH